MKFLANSTFNSLMVVLFSIIFQFTAIAGVAERPANPSQPKVTVVFTGKNDSPSGSAKVASVTNDYADSHLRDVILRTKTNTPFFRNRLAKLEAFNANRSPLYARSADMELDKLINFVVGDLDKYWRSTFTAAGLNYNPPKSIRLYSKVTDSPCGKTELGNAFYCPASHDIWLDLNLLKRYYTDVGDFTVLVILAHEWGHAVQYQLGITKSRYLSAPVELQADCLCGAYAKSAEENKYLEDGDVDEGVDGLFQLKDPKGVPWLSSNAHGKGYQRINSFLDGFKGGAFPCGFFGSLVGIWDAEITESGFSQRIAWQANANGTDTFAITTPRGVVSISSTWRYADGVLYQQNSTGSSSGTITWIDGNHVMVTILQNGDGLSSRGRTRHYFRRK